MRTIVAVLLILTLLHATTVYGEIYDGEEFELLNNAVIKVSGLTTLQLVANENYSIELEPGEYQVTTRFYENGTMKYYSKDKVTAAGNETRFDIVVFPVDPQLIDDFDIDIPIPHQPGLGGTNLFKSELDEILFLVVIATLVGIMLFFLLKKTERTELNSENGEGGKIPVESQGFEPEKEYEIDEDGKRVLKILGENEGRMIQKELRNIMNFFRDKNEPGDFRT